ncbi:MAG: ATP-binding protein [Methanobrevibacter sp.]|jgi:hypothetical protein|nr:ATP-binding protein [Methanobrevibacter sp.]
MNRLAWGNCSELEDDEFYNRIEEIDFLKSLLESSSNRTSPTIVVPGLRGVGKTVLLKKIKKELERDFLIVYIDLTLTYSFQIGQLNEVSLMEHLYQSLMKSCEEKKFKTFKDKLKKTIKTKKIKVGQIMDFEGYPIPIPESETDIKNLLDFVLDLPQKIYEEHENEIKGVIIILDEFHALTDLGKNLKQFFWLFRGKIQSQRNVSYIFSSSINSNNQIIETLSGSEGAFGGRVLTLTINPFTKETVKSYLEEKVPELKFDDKGFERFYSCTKGLPFYINTFANLLPKNTILDDENVKNEFRKSISLLANSLKLKWGRLYLSEQKIITTLLYDDMKRMEIGKKLNRQTGSLSTPLNKLINENLIKLENKKYTISEPILKEWLKAEYKNKGVFPYRLE